MKERKAAREREWGSELRERERSSLKEGGWGREGKRKGEMVLECPRVKSLFGAFKFFFFFLKRHYPIFIPQFSRENSLIALKKNTDFYTLKFRIFITFKKTHNQISVTKYLQPDNLTQSFSSTSILFLNILMKMQKLKISIFIIMYYSTVSITIT